MTNPIALKTISPEAQLPLSASELKSENLLALRMGVSTKEIREIYQRYGVSASQLVELMQLSKYAFLYSGQVQGRCQPCVFTAHGGYGAGF